MGAALRRFLIASWQRRTLAAVFLWPVSLLYGALASLRRQLYSSGIWRVQRAARIVVVVGNVVVGGGGKTSLVIALVRHLQSRGLKPGVVSRGYRRQGRRCQEVLETSRVSEVGDEPMLIRQATGAPVFVAPARIDAARALLAEHPGVDVIISDDGLQHYGLYRDIEICVFDDSGAGNGLLLPAGPLREPWPRPADLVLSTGNPRNVHGFSAQRVLASHARRSDGALVALQELRALTSKPGESFWAVAGIARPEAFFAMLRSEGLKLARTEALPDHAAFDDRNWSGTGNDRLICTEKDAFKLWLHRPDALAIPLELNIEPGFWKALDALVDAGLRSKLSSTDGHSTT